MVSEKTRILMSKAQTGRKHSEATKEKIRQVRLGKKRKPFSETTKKKMSKAKLGNEYSLGFKHGEKIKKFHRNLMLGNKYRLGIKHTEATKKKIRKSSLGEKGNNWQGGITKSSSLIRSSARYVKWRKDIFKRDNYICQKCHLKASGFLEVHHKKSFSSILKRYGIVTNEEAVKCKELWGLKNGVTLCKECHKLTNTHINKINTNMLAKVSSLISIDPGSIQIGIAFFQDEKLIESKQIKLSGDTFYSRLRNLKLSVIKFFEKHSIVEFMAVETPFIGRNPQAGLKIGQCRGLILGIGFDYDCKVIDIAPQETRRYYGVSTRAKKEEYQRIVKLENQNKVMGSDEADAVAIGCTALHKIKKTRLYNEAI